MIEPPPNTVKCSALWTMLHCFQRFCQNINLTNWTYWVFLNTLRLPEVSEELPPVMTRSVSIQETGSSKCQILQTIIMSRLLANLGHIYQVCSSSVPSTLISALLPFYSLILASHLSLSSLSLSPSSSSREETQP